MIDALRGFKDWLEESQGVIGGTTASIVWLCHRYDLIMVRAEGLEPSRLSTLEPKSSASANSATLARL